MTKDKPKGKNRLMLRNEQGQWKFSESFLTYGQAVVAGQQRNENGFMVETHGRVPSVDEQLLRVSRNSKQKAVLESI